MDNLLCDELLLSSPATPCRKERKQRNEDGNCAGLFYRTKEDYEDAVSMWLEKELCCLPEPGYLERLYQSKNLSFARSRAIQWLIKSHSRLNVSLATIFDAASYLDRFMSTNQCQYEKYWMVELLSVACLSVASKFTETSTPSLHEVQEDLDHSFQPITIQRMELTLLQALGWRLGSPTAYSYLEFFTANMDSLNSHLQNDLVARLNELLLGTILDCRFVEYRPSTAAASALWCILEELAPSNPDAHLVHIAGLFHQNHKDDHLVKCHKIMKMQLCNPLNNTYYCPSSPVTVLLTGQIGINDHDVDLSLFKRQRSKDDKHKRKREEE